MGDMLRSEMMYYCEFYLQTETAFEIMTAVGRSPCIQFLSTSTGRNPKVNLYAASEVCRCMNMERKMAMIMQELQKEGTSIPEYTGRLEPLEPRDMLETENFLDKWEEDIAQTTNNQKALLKSSLELKEMMYILTELGPLLGDGDLNNDPREETSRSKEEEKLSGSIFVIAGTIKRVRCLSFELMLWRVTRGNIYYRQADKDKLLTDPSTGVTFYKVGFLIVVQSKTLYDSIVKVCSGFGANVYNIPPSHQERNDLLNKLKLRLEDIDKVLEKSYYYRCKTLNTFAKIFKKTQMRIKLAKANYYMLNMLSMDITRKCLVGRGWVPQKCLTNVQNILGHQAVDAIFPSFVVILQNPAHGSPPTFHRTNRFTKAFQNLINAYGSSTYQELNPGLYTIITFPFLFGIMFGDFGHGLIMLLFAVWMVVKEKEFLAARSTNEIWNIFFSGRYLILLMGIFSLYSGILYTDIFSRAFCIESSRYTISGDPSIFQETVRLSPLKDIKKSPYMFGKDPMWSLAKNRIVFENSLKMKLSIVLGVVHMMFGISLSLFNHIHVRHYHAIFLEFIPQIWFLTSLFFYLVAMIFMKWSWYSATFTDPKINQGCAPLVLILFIDMVLFKKSKPVADTCDAYMYSGQRTVQIILLCSALLCVPIMLFGSPVYQLAFGQKRFRRQSSVTTSSAELRKYQSRSKILYDINDIIKKEEGSNPHSNEPNSFGEMMIFQGIHTIEFVLSTVSHTASYLRLWALSLAHAQLSDMLWDMVFANLGLKMKGIKGYFMLPIVFAVWASFTVAIMVLMEGLSAFLHTLRLHWVEFMSKFYGGQGVLFTPFCYSEIINSEKEDFAATKIVCKTKVKTNLWGLVEEDAPVERADAKKQKENKK